MGPEKAPGGTCRLKIFHVAWKHLCVLHTAEETLRQNNNTVMFKGRGVMRRSCCYRADVDYSSHIKAIATIMISVFVTKRIFKFLYNNSESFCSYNKQIS